MSGKSAVVSLSIDRDLLEQLDAWVASKGFPSRSAGVQRLIREGLVHTAEGELAGLVAATVSFVYDHHARELLDRLTHLQHQHLDLVVSSTHFHLDHSRCLEVLTLRGPAARVRELGEALVATRGVERGRVVLIPVGEAPEQQDHPERGPAWHSAAHDHTHDHAPPKPQGKARVRKRSR
ncbi:MAG: nickel-responsive transcriptional regulator NikR [Planctomycetota bacterium]